MDKKDKSPSRISRRDASQRISRRNLLKLSIAGGATAAAGIAGLLLLRPETRGMSLQELLERINKDSISIIGDEIIRRGIEKNPNEIQLWQIASSNVPPISVTEIASDESKRQQVNDTLSKTLIDMEQSSNALISNAAKGIQSLRASGDLTIAISPPLVSKGGRPDNVTFLTALGFDSQKNKFFQQLNVNPYVLYNNPDRGLFACGLAHEYEHMQNTIKAVSTLSSEQTKYQRAKEREAKELVLEEARGFLVSARAYIEHAGFTDDLSLPAPNGSFRLSLQQDAAALILTGNNSQNPLWIDYINWKIK